ncbi:hypothetical protein AVEN_93811-1 [Araneus ventricosus]|uniref:Uncharacterized protein n=1 Tax=Araneus ventricosus TaxID=182803 RepID=A0A4Y2AZZ0_ARAVE|nr:hypothetical protein AVEN_93811-1 [Araneus ventricosus]
MHNLLFPGHLSHFHPILTRCRPVGASLWTFSRLNGHFVLLPPIDATSTTLHSFLPPPMDELGRSTAFISGSREIALKCYLRNIQNGKRRIHFQKLTTYAIWKPDKDHLINFGSGSSSSALFRNNFDPVMGAN